VQVLLLECEFLLELCLLLLYNKKIFLKIFRNIFFKKKFEKKKLYFIIIYKFSILEKVDEKKI
jgi:hypothetical protein